MKRYAIFYASNPVFMLEPEHGTELMTLSEFHKWFVFMGVYPAENPEDLYITFNHCDSNPLARTKENPNNPLQELVARKAGHTSMTVGDVVVDLETGILQMCSTLGWCEICLTDEKRHREQAVDLSRWKI